MFASDAIRVPPPDGPAWRPGASYRSMQDRRAQDQGSPRSRPGRAHCRPGIGRLGLLSSCGRANVPPVPSAYAGIYMARGEVPVSLPYQPGTPELDQQLPGFFNLPARVARLEQDVFVLQRTVNQLEREVDRLSRRLARCCPRFSFGEEA